ncbi:MAG: hypothetical protein HYS32_00310 [Candidatus Woesearchaeota archaeon]|nr:MAG: hypothetical protein HYS32_00310 [Candidatus Woesearchaeota archaeon]
MKKIIVFGIVFLFLFSSFALANEMNADNFMHMIFTDFGETLFKRENGNSFIMLSFIGEKTPDKSEEKMDREYVSEELPFIVLNEKREASLVSYPKLEVFMGKLEKKHIYLYLDKDPRDAFHTGTPVFFELSNMQGNKPFEGQLVLDSKKVLTYDDGSKEIITFEILPCADASVGEERYNLLRAIDKDTKNVWEHADIPGEAIYPDGDLGNANARVIGNNVDDVQTVFLFNIVNGRKTVGVNNKFVEALKEFNSAQPCIPKTDAVESKEPKTNAKEKKLLSSERSDKFRTFFAVEYQEVLKPFSYADWEHSYKIENEN